MPHRTAAPGAGTLYVVATPIGNLEDITLRALKVLKAVDLVAAEDTRRTANLLRHYQIATPVLSVHEHNEAQRAPAIIERLTAGQSIALVTDAGTPAVSDPGAKLVAAVRKAGLPIEPIPGPSAVLAALSASGLSTDGFVFAGFPPNRSKDRKQWLETLDLVASRAVVFFEAPHRIKRTLQDLSLLVKQPIMVFRELTKVHEEVLSGHPADLVEQIKEPRGEFTVVIPPAGQSSAEVRALTDAEIACEFGLMTNNERGSTRRETIRTLATKLGLSTRAVYQSLERCKIG